MRWLHMKYLHHLCWNASDPATVKELRKLNLYLPDGYHRPFLSVFKRNHASIDCRSYSTSTQTCRKPPWKILFFGSDRFSEIILEALNDNRFSADTSVVQHLEVVTNPTKTTVRKFAESANLNIRDWPVGDICGQFDVGVLASFGHLIPARVINLFPHGIVNVHPSLLPRWRGAAPIIHTILAGDDITGVSIMKLRPKKFDVGGVLSTTACKVPDEATTFSLRDHLGKLGAELLIKTLQELSDLKEVEQSSEGITSAPKVKTSMTWLDWEHQTCVDIDRQYRALSELVPLRSRLDERVVKLFDLHGVSQDLNDVTLPGTVIYDMDTDTLQVKCLDGWIGFKHISIKKKMSALDFHNGYVSKVSDKKLHLTSGTNGLDTTSYRKLIKQKV